MKWLDRLLGVKTFIVDVEFESFKMLSYVKARTKDEAVMKVLNLKVTENKRLIKVSAWMTTDE
jgi:hypothetical protein